MVLFALRRFLLGVPLLLGITFVSFLVIQLAPGEPVELTTGDLRTESTAQARQARSGSCTGSTSRSPSSTGCGSPASSASTSDARSNAVMPVSAPNEGEKVRHYLWLFWSEIPKDGHWAIFDRSWYGRVLVERVEGIASEAAWRRAYQEINEFERAIAGHGAVIVKCWLDIAPEEQLRRFRKREQSPLKSHKLTEEDWRNRAKWPDYHAAVSDMIRQTSTVHAPWTIVEADDKPWARVKVLETVVKAVEGKV